jgi:MYXO-CTERM domain-containing protein
MAVAVCALIAPRVALGADVQADASSFKAMLPKLMPGDTMHLAAGTYPHFSISGLNGTSSSWITITGPASGSPATVEADAVPCCNTIEITGSSFVAIEHLTIDGKNVDGAFGLSASGTASPVHDIRVEGCTFLNHHGSQQHDAISTKTPTWGWIIRNNRISSVGTGLYLGNSTGDDPFIGGIIEGNLVENPIGYCMEIKFQKPRPTVAGMPTTASATLVRNNVFIKNDDPSPDGDRPNVLVGGFPDSGAGSTDRYEIYGNVFFHNPRESLLQVSGRVTVHDNIFIDAPGSAILLQNHDLPLKLAYVYNNTIYAAGTGISFGSAASQGDGVIGNLVFAGTPIRGSIKTQKDNLFDSTANAAMYVKTPSTMLGAMDFYPIAGKCQGTTLDLSMMSQDVDYAVDFNGTPKGELKFRGAYAGEGANPGWAIAGAIKSGGARGDAGVVAGAGGGGGGGAGAVGVAEGGAVGGGASGPNGAGGGTGGTGASTPANEAAADQSSGCGCRVGARGGAWGLPLGLGWMIGIIARRRRVRPSVARNPGHHGSLRSLRRS